MRRVRGWLWGLFMAERGEVEDLREEVADLRAEVEDLTRKLRALAEREAVMNAHGYVLGSGNKKPLHRFIVDAPPDRVVHHRNGDPLDNRKKNLEIKTAVAHTTDHHAERKERRLYSRR